MTRNTQLRIICASLIKELSKQYTVDDSAAYLIKGVDVNTAVIDDYFSKQVKIKQIQEDLDECLNELRELNRLG